MNITQPFQLTISDPQDIAYLHCGSYAEFHKSLLNDLTIETQVAILTTMREMMAGGFLMDADTIRITIQTVEFIISKL